MKHFLAFSIILVASHFALAMPSYWAAIETSAYAGDQMEGVGGVGYYSGYYCTATEAESLFGGSSVSAIESYLKDNFAKAKAGATLYDSVAYSDGEYHILDYTEVAFAAADYIAIAFYGDEAYRVFGYDREVGGSAVLTPYGQLSFNETTAAAGTVGDWQQTVPEPASGLLLLFGIAGLALRRQDRCVRDAAFVRGV